MESFQARMGTVIVGDKNPVAVMGVINLDPHSFYSGSFYPSMKDILSATEMMIEDGADIIDIGGASSAPESRSISVEEERNRIEAPIKQITMNWDIPVSIDTQHAQVAEAAISRGASIVNDVSGLKTDSNMARVIQNANASCVLMAATKHPGDSITTLQIISALQQSLDLAQASGIPRNHIAIDPGLGFGKPFECDLEILRHLKRFRVLQQPILLGVSRKSFIGKVLGYPSPQNRLFGTLATVTFALLKGVHVIRAHDVRATKDCIKMVSSLQSSNEGE